MSKINIGLNSSNLEFIGWKSYNTIVKKAMEQEFSWSGLVISLSIAFFIVIASAQALSMTYQSVMAKQGYRTGQPRIYQLENVRFINQGADIRLDSALSHPDVIRVDNIAILQKEEAKNSIFLANIA